MLSSVGDGGGAVAVVVVVVIVAVVVVGAVGCCGCNYVSWWHAQGCCLEKQGFNCLFVSLLVYLFDGLFVYLFCVFVHLFVLLVCLFYMLVCLFGWLVAWLVGLVIEASKVIFGGNASRCKRSLGQQ